MFNSFDATTVFFLALAVFVVLRLRSVLGQRPQRDAPPRNQADAGSLPPRRGRPARQCHSDGHGGE